MSAARTVVAETQSSTPYGGYLYYGYTVYEVDGRFEVVIRLRTYDGIRVASKWDSRPATLDATTKDAAITEAHDQTVSYMRAITGSTG